nr:unnamed protein product [Digitaria exilis]
MACSSRGSRPSNWSDPNPDTFALRPPAPAAIVYSAAYSIASCPPLAGTHSCARAPRALRVPMKLVELADEVGDEVHGDAHDADALGKLRAEDETGAEPPAGPGLVHRVAPEVDGLLAFLAVAVPTATMASS